MIKLSKYHSLTIFRNIKIKKGKIHVGDEYKSEEVKFNGIYFEETPDFIAIYSYLSKNYLYVADKLIEITFDVSIQYYCGEREEKSWIKIYNKDTLIYEVTYINTAKEPYIDFASGWEDWEVVNFAYHLASYINKARENPHVALFS